MWLEALPQAALIQDASLLTMSLTPGHFRPHYEVVLAVEAVKRIASRVRQLDREASTNRP